MHIQIYVEQRQRVINPFYTRAHIPPNTGTLSAPSRNLGGKNGVGWRKHIDLQKSGGGKKSQVTDFSQRGVGSVSESLFWSCLGERVFYDLRYVQPVVLLTRARWIPGVAGRVVLRVPCERVTCCFGRRTLVGDFRHRAGRLSFLL